MSNKTFSVNGTVFEDRFVKFSELNVESPFVMARQLWSWGDTTAEGDGAAIARSFPVQTGTLTNWNAVSASNHTLGVRTDGTLWVWGLNSKGQLGNNNIITSSQATRIGPETDTLWRSVSAGAEVSFGIKKDGTLWTWGSGFGAGGVVVPLAYRSSPVKVGTNSDWEMVDAKASHGVAVRKDGTLWTWGFNAAGNLGLNDSINRSAPIQIGDSSQWKKAATGLLYNTIALKTDGTLWAWGRGTYGALGLNSTVARSSPVQVDTGTDWANIAAGNDTVFAIKENGTLWAWGAGSYGRLGLNTAINVSSPVQIGTMSNWKTVSSHAFHTIATKTDGSIWTWGAGADGRLGLNSVIDRSSPVRVGSSNNWSAGIAGWARTHVIRFG